MKLGFMKLARDCRGLLFRLSDRESINHFFVTVVVVVIIVVE